MSNKESKGESIERHDKQLLRLEQNIQGLVGGLNQLASQCAAAFNSNDAARVYSDGCFKGIIKALSELTGVTEKEFFDKYCEPAIADMTEVYKEQFAKMMASHGLDINGQPLEPAEAPLEAPLPEAEEDTQPLESPAPAPTPEEPVGSLF